MDVFVPALVFGAVLACSVGPIALLIVNTGIGAGTLAALRCALGAALADFTFALPAFAGGAVLAQWLSERMALLSVFAGLALIAFGVWMMVPALRSGPMRAAAVSGLRGTYVLTLTNPLTVVAFAAFALGAGTGRSWFAGALGVFLGSLAVQVLLALAAGGLRPWLASGPAPRVLQAVSGMGIAVFGALKVLAAVR